MFVVVAFFEVVVVTVIDVVATTVRVDVAAAGVDMWAISCVCRLFASSLESPLQW